MKKIILICNAGLSSGMLAKKMEQESGGKYLIEAFGESEYLSYLDDVSLILVGPQLRFAMPQIKASTSIRVEAINPMKYGIMNAKGILEDVEEILKKEGVQ